MKALLINPEKQTIEEIQIEDGLKPMYDAIGNDCEMVEAPIQFEHDILYCDKEGRLKANNYGFYPNSWDYPILGNALIMGVDEDGESTDVKSTIGEIKKWIQDWFYEQS